MQTDSIRKILIFYVRKLKELDLKQQIELPGVLGIDKESDFRIKSGIEYVMNQILWQEIHICLRII